MKSLRSMEYPDTTTIILPPIGSRRSKDYSNNLTATAHSTCASSNNIPSAYLCPLTLSVMKDPVIDTEGYSYERAAIQKWLSRVSRSPITRKPLRSKDLIPNRYLKDAIADRMGPHWSSSSTGGTKPPPTPSSDDGGVSTNRQIISNILDDISISTGKQISLNEKGLCSFTYRHLTVIIEVPCTERSFWIYTEFTDLPSLPPPESHTLSRRLLHLNYMQQQTRGGCLSLDQGSNTVVFHYTDRVEDMTTEGFQIVLEDYIESCLVLHEDLMTFAQKLSERSVERGDHQFKRVVMQSMEGEDDRDGGEIESKIKQSVTTRGLTTTKTNNAMINNKLPRSGYDTAVPNMDYKDVPIGKGKEMIQQTVAKRGKRKVTTCARTGACHVNSAVQTAHCGYLKRGQLKTGDDEMNTTTAAYQDDVCRRSRSIGNNNSRYHRSMECAKRRRINNDDLKSIEYGDLKSIEYGDLKSIEKIEMWGDVL